MIHVSTAVVILALTAAAPEIGPPEKSRATTTEPATGQRVEPPCAGPACPVPIPYPPTKSVADGPSGTPASTDLITIPLCPGPSGGMAQSNGNEAGTSSGNCSKPIGLGPPPDVKH